MVRERSVVGTLVLGLVLGVSSLGFTQEKPAKPERGEHHPQIHAAMRALHIAARHLEHAAHDFGGHRAKALELVKQAEGELRQAIEFARAHPEMGGRPGARSAPASAGGATTTPAPKSQ